MKEYALILQSQPSPLDIDIVQTSANPIHAYLNPIALQCLDELIAAELRSAVGVEDGRDPIPGYSLMQAIEAELGVHRLTEVPAQDLSAVQINDRRQVDHPPVKLDVGDIRSPDLIDIGNGLPSEQIRVLLEFPFRRPGGLKPGPKSFETQPLVHEPDPLLRGFRMAVPHHIVTHLPIPVGRMGLPCIQYS